MAVLWLLMSTNHSPVSLIWCHINSLMGIPLRIESKATCENYDYDNALERQHLVLVTEGKTFKTKQRLITTNLS